MCCSKTEKSRIVGGTIGASSRHVGKRVLGRDLVRRGAHAPCASAAWSRSSTPTSPASTRSAIAGDHRGAGDAVKCRRVRRASESAATATMPRPGSGRRRGRSAGVVLLPAPNARRALQRSPGSARSGARCRPGVPRRRPRPRASSSASTIPSSTAWAAPWPQCGVMPCAASPTRTTRPRCQGAGTRTVSIGRRTTASSSTISSRSLGDRAGERAEALAVDRCGPSAPIRSRLVGCRRLDREHVHQVITERHETGVRLRADEDPDPVEPARPGQVVAPAHLAGEGGVQARTEHGRARLGVQPVGANHEVVGAARAVAELDVDAIRPLPDGGER